MPSMPSENRDRVMLDSVDAYCQGNLSLKDIIDKLEKYLWWGRMNRYIYIMALVILARLTYSSTHPDFPFYEKYWIYEALQEIDEFRTQTPTHPDYQMVVQLQTLALRVLGHRLLRNSKVHRSRIDQIDYAVCMNIGKIPKPAELGPMQSPLRMNSEQISNLHCEYIF